MQPDVIGNTDEAASETPSGNARLMSGVAGENVHSSLTVAVLPAVRGLPNTGGCRGFSVQLMPFLFASICACRSPVARRC